MVKLLVIGLLSPGAPYVPAATLIVSPDEAALTAAPMVLKQPSVPPGLTQSVAAPAGPDTPVHKQNLSSPPQHDRSQLLDPSKGRMDREL
jgi:hypothetical protein